MQDHPVIFWLVVINLIVSGLVMIYRGANRTRRTYGPGDVIGAAVEIPLMIWGISILAS